MWDFCRAQRFYEYMMLSVYDNVVVSKKPYKHVAGSLVKFSMTGCRNILLKMWFAVNRWDLSLDILSGILVLLSSNYRKVGITLLFIVWNSQALTSSCFLWNRSDFCYCSTTRFRIKRRKMMMMMMIRFWSVFVFLFAIFPYCSNILSKYQLNHRSKTCFLECTGVSSWFNENLFILWRCCCCCCWRKKEFNKWCFQSW